jgi:hypothetical protein
VISLVSTSFKGLGFGGRGGPRSTGILPPPFFFFTLPWVFTGVLPDLAEAGAAGALDNGGSTSVSFLGLGPPWEEEKALGPADIVLESLPNGIKGKWHVLFATLS